MYENPWTMSDFQFQRKNDFIQVAKSRCYIDATLRFVCGDRSLLVASLVYRPVRDPVGRCASCFHLREPIAFIISGQRLVPHPEEQHQNICVCKLVCNDHRPCLHCRICPIAHQQSLPVGPHLLGPKPLALSSRDYDIPLRNVLGVKS